MEEKLKLPSEDAFGKAKVTLSRVSNINDVFADKLERKIKSP